MKSDAFLAPASVREDRARPLSCRGRAFAMDHPSVKFCQAQAVAHAAQADATNLPNVRAINLTAARSWLRAARAPACGPAQAELGCGPSPIAMIVE